MRPGGDIDPASPSAHLARQAPGGKVVSGPRERPAPGLPGDKGPDVHSRGADPEGGAFLFLDEMGSSVRSQGDIESILEGLDTDL